MIYKCEECEKSIIGNITITTNNETYCSSCTTLKIKQGRELLSLMARVRKCIGDGCEIMTGSDLIEFLRKEKKELLKEIRTREKAINLLNSI